MVPAKVLSVDTPKRQQADNIGMRKADGCCAKKGESLGLIDVWTVHC